jgi:hypothetical protein
MSTNEHTTNDIGKSSAGTTSRTMNPIVVKNIMIFCVFSFSAVGPLLKRRWVLFPEVERDQD